MGLFGKIKNIFYDEEIVEVEVPSQEIKKEEKPRIEEVRLPKREVEKPVRQEEVKPPVYTERELFKTETTFKFPVVEEEEEEHVRTRTRPNILDLERTTIKPVKENKPETKYSERSYDRNYNDRSYSERANTHNDKNSQVKTFKPSPVISPIYGVLDKNYKKEEITLRQHTNIRHNQADMNYDSVRRKAYGTLEDELENTLSKINSRKDEVMQTIEEVEKLDTEANSKSIEDLLNEIEGNKDMSIGEIEERLKDRMEEEESGYSVKTPTKVLHESTEEIPTIKKQKPVYEEETPIKKEPTKMEEEDGFDKTLEHDLFNLIDSMYEEREGE